MKFKLDENFSPKLAVIFEAYHHDARTVLDEDLCAATDTSLFENLSSGKAVSGDDGQGFLEYYQFSSR
jgi:hypothetical protein